LEDWILPRKTRHFTWKTGFSVGKLAASLGKVADSLEDWLLYMKTGYSLGNWPLPWNTEFF
jgi:hypothetical protein